MTAAELKLDGCTPEPLMNYLKALGILRLLSEDAEHGDSSARGAWRDGVFVLQTRLGKDDLAKFFLNHYRPTPILAPWNGGSGFYKKWDVASGSFKNRDAVESVERIAKSSHSRFANYRQQIQATKQALGELARPVDMAAEIRGLSNDERKKLLDSMLLFDVSGQVMNLGKAEKDDFLATVRSSVVGEETLLWLDAALVLLTGQKKNRTEAPVLGSGGNVGNSDFSAMFVQAVADILPLQEDAEVPPTSIAMLRAALFSEPAANLPKFSIGQFDPGMAGGANSTHGTEGPPLNNPWNYVLMLEGCLVMGGAISRRMGAGRGSGVFPFVVRSSSVGYGSAGVDTTRGEVWLPLWPQLTSLAEVRSLLSEGRAEIGGRRATTGVGFARAVASLGVDRGIESFVRYEFQKRFGDQYLATPLGRFHVRAQPDAVLLREADAWLQRFRNACPSKSKKKSKKGDKKLPARFSAVLQRIDATMLDFCRYGGPASFADILCSLGEAERELALSAGRSGDTEAKKLSPLAGLSPNWLKAAADHSIEFELALALAGLHDRSRKIGALRTNLEAVTFDKNRWTWADRDRRVVWNKADLSANLVAVLDRRLMDGSRAGCEDLPIAPRRVASLVAISSFLSGEVDDRRIEELLWGLTAVNHQQRYPELPLVTFSAPPVPRAYALLKLLFLHRPIRMRVNEYGETMAEFTRHGEQGLHILPETEVLTLLCANRWQEACGLAMRRLRASGLVPLPHRRSGGPIRDNVWKDEGDLDGCRLAAALLFPIGPNTLTQLVRLVTRPSSEMTTSTL